LKEEKEKEALPIKKLLSLYDENNLFKSDQIIV